MIDCSLDAQNRRRAELATLRARLTGGVQSVSDRSRSVSYVSPDALMLAIGRIEREIALCEGVPRARRLAYIPLIKGI